MKPTFLLSALLIVLAIPSTAQKFRCSVVGNGDMKINILWIVAIHDNSLVFRMPDQTDSLVFTRKQTPDHKEIRYNDGVKDFVMAIAEKQGTIDGEKYTHLLIATPEDKSMKTTTYYCVKE